MTARYTPGDDIPYTKIIRLTFAEGGASYFPSQGLFYGKGNPGYIVAKETYCDVALVGMDVSLLRSVAQVMPASCGIGTWRYATQDGNPRVLIEAIKWTDNLDDARALGRAYGQAFVYDCAEGANVPVDSKLRVREGR